MRTNKETKKKIYSIIKENKQDTNEEKELLLRAKTIIQLIELREKKGYSQKEVAALMGVSNQQVAKFESCANSPTLTFLVKYASAIKSNIEVTVKGIKLFDIEKKANEN